MSEAHEITFTAAVDKVQTLADGGIRVTFDLPETAITEAALLMECKRTATPLKIACLTMGNRDAIREGQVRKSKWKAAEESGMDDDSGEGWQQDGDNAQWAKDC